MSISQNSLDIFENEDLPFPVPISILQNLSDKVIMLFTKCCFYRNQFNLNLEMMLDQGTDISPGLIWLSPSYYLPSGFFNSTKPISEVSFPNNNSVQINRTMTFYHDITVMFKLTLNSDADNYQNFRELRCRLVMADGLTQYDSSLFGYAQPATGSHFEVNFAGSINHNAGDKIQLQFTLAQDNTHSNQSATLLTIFNLSWNIIGLKVIS